MGARLNLLENPNTWLVANLETALAARKWRQADLARATGLTPTGIGAIVNGHSWPGPDTLARIAVALGACPADLLRDPAGNGALKRPAKLELLEIVAALKDDEAELLLPGLKALRAGLLGGEGELESDQQTDEPPQEKNRG